MANRIPRVPVREQDPKVRATNFEEVCYGYNKEEALLEASRCLNCKNPRCMTACPVGLQIPRFIAELAQGNIAGAAAVIAEDSSLPAVCGRVCPQETQCEGSCVLGVKGEPVAIGKLERFVADYSRELAGSSPLETSGCAGPLPSGDGPLPRTMPRVARFPEGTASQSPRQKVAVIGSGPAGLACASDLAKWGYDVTIFEALHKAGGVLEYGIPEFRLPKDKVLKHEIEEVRRLGVKIETNVIIGRTVTIDSLMDKEGFKAVFIGTGAGLPKFMGIPGENYNGVFSANEFLTRNNLMKAWREDYLTPIHAGKKVCVVGGGNVAMDAAPTALRLGAEVHIVYRRTEEPDESGRRSPVAIEGSEFEIPTETVIMALGTSPNPLISKTTKGLEVTRRGCLVANEEGATTRPGVFAGGDAVTGAATVILAMGAGRTAAKAIDAYLKQK